MSHYEEVLFHYRADTSCVQSQHGASAIARATAAFEQGNFFEAYGETAFMAAKLRSQSHLRTEHQALSALVLNQSF